VDPQQILDQLDPDQRRVAQTIGGPVQVIAGAGTGKTRALTHRIAYASAVGALDPRATLAVTFTTTAANEIRSRLEAMGVAGVQSRTFHSACLRQAKFFWPEIYNAQLPPVVENRSGLVVQACQRVGITPSDAALRQIAGEISWTKQTNVLPESYVELASQGHRQLSCASLEQAADAIVAYEQVKQVECVIDLDDVLLCTLALLATESAVARRVRRTYRHFLFDEFQDISPVQARLVDLWVGSASGDVCVVGDPAQTIHSFAGSRSIYLEKFASQRPGGVCLEMTRNYRSTPQILQAANIVRGVGIDLQAVREKGPALVFGPAADPLAESVAIAQWLKDRTRDGLAWNQLAVLFRTRAQAEAIRQILADEGVPFSYGVPESTRQAVHLGTLHSAKGLEWEAVCLGGLHDGVMPHPLASSAEQIGEERRLFYVGMTRARTWLRLSWPSRVDAKVTRASRFLADLPGLQSA
jgi:DNA helicase-2/ATP-dependent DNA helicase PcrA